MNQFFQWPTERPILCSLAEKSRTSEEQASLTVVYWASKMLYDEIICYRNYNYKKKKELYIYSIKAGNLFNSGTIFLIKYSSFVLLCIWSSLDILKKGIITNLGPDPLVQENKCRLTPRPAFLLKWSRCKLVRDVRHEVSPIYISRQPAHLRTYSFWCCLVLQFLVLHVICARIEKLNLVGEKIKELPVMIILHKWHRGLLHLLTPPVSLFNRASILIIPVMFIYILDYPWPVGSN